MTPTTTVPAGGLKKMVTGVQAVSGARAVMLRKQAEENWPFPWIDPVLRSQHIFQQGFIAAPDPVTGIQEVLELRVPDGSDFYPRWLCLQVKLPLQGDWNPGDFTFSIDVNSPIGVPAPAAMPYAYYQNIQVTVGGMPGAPLTNPAPFVPGEMSVLHERDIMRVKVININIGIGAPQYFVAGIWGTLFPTGGPFSE